MKAKNKNLMTLEEIKEKTTVSMEQENVMNLKQVMIILKLVH